MAGKNQFVVTLAYKIAGCEETFCMTVWADDHTDARMAGLGALRDKAFLLRYLENMAEEAIQSGSVKSVRTAFPYEPAHLRGERYPDGTVVHRRRDALGSPEFIENCPSKDNVRRHVRVHHQEADNLWAASYLEGAKTCQGYVTLRIAEKGPEWLYIPVSHSG